MVPALGGSFEECPPSLLDFAARDRRWCQGNLQHLAVLPARGLHWVSRLHLLTGIGSYLTAPLWLLFLVLGILISLQAQFVRPGIFPERLFPVSEMACPGSRSRRLGVRRHHGTADPAKAARLHSARDRRGRLRQFGGGLTVVAGLLGRDIAVGVDSARDDDLPVGRGDGDSAGPRCRLAGAAPRRRRTCRAAELVRKYALPTLFGMAMAAIAYAVSLPLLLWMAPVIAGLLLCIPIAMLSSGRAFRSRDCCAPRSRPLRRPCLFGPTNWRKPRRGLAASSPLLQLRDDRNLLETHLINLPGDGRRNRGQIDPDLAIARAKIEEAENFDEAVGYLTPRETFAVLGSNALLRAVCAMPHGKA